jgi:trans-aconitate methyltransferase
MGCHILDWDAKKFAETCGRVTEHGARLVDLLRSIRCGRVLDLGCGTGVLTNDIAGFADEVIGIDASPAMIDKARETYPGIDFRVMDATTLIWEDYFDAVFSNAVLHFIKEQNKLLRSVCRALKRGGTLICEFGAAGSLSALLDAVEVACLSRGKDYALRFYYPEKDEYARLLEKNGFNIQSIETYDLDTKLNDGEPWLRNWVNQIFNVEMGWFGLSEREIVLGEIETALRPEQWDGACWHLLNKRIRVVARK